MKKKHREPEEQLHMEPQSSAVVETEETYSLEDIMREFGGWRTLPETEPSREPEPAASPEPAAAPNPEPKPEPLPLVVRKAEPAAESAAEPGPESAPESEAPPAKDHVVRVAASAEEAPRPIIPL